MSGLAKRLEEFLKGEVGGVELRGSIFDDGGNRVDYFEGPAATVLAEAFAFAVVQGTDPEEAGEGARPGRVEFEPVPGETLGYYVRDDKSGRFKAAHAFTLMHGSSYASRWQDAEVYRTRKAAEEARDPFGESVVPASDIIGD